MDEKNKYSKDNITDNFGNPMDIIKTFFKNASKRPAMYTGEESVKSLETYYNGIIYGLNEYEKRSPCFAPYWDSNGDIQRYMFLNEGISILHAASINGWSVFYRYFGNSYKYSIEEFAKLMDNVPFSVYNENDNNISEKIYGGYCFYKYEDKKNVSSDDIKKSRLNKRTLESEKMFFNEIVNIAGRLIANKSKELICYIHIENLFLQTRFFYIDENDKYVDFVSLKENRNYEENLIFLHSYISSMDIENLELTIIKKNGNVRVYKKKIKKIDYKKMRGDFTKFKENDLLVNRFNNWKRKYVISKTRRLKKEEDKQ